MRWVREPYRRRPGYAKRAAERGRLIRPWDKKIIHSELIIDADRRLRHIARQAEVRPVRRPADDGTATLTQAAGGQGSNSAIMRQFNERVILTALRRLGEASKADLARQASLTQNTAGQIVRELERQRLVRTVGKRTGARGQPATLLQLNADGAYSIGIQLGRRSVDCLLIDFSGQVLEARRHERAFPMPEEALGIALEEIAALRKAIPAGGRSRLAGVGLAIPYNLGSWRRELDIPSETYAAWNEFDIAARLREETGLPVLVENDGTAAAVAELFQGHGRELDDFVTLYIGAAIGGGVVLGGDYRRGATGNAGDIGLMPVPPSRLATAPQPTRPLDILLTRASVNSLVRHLRATAGIEIADRAGLDEAVERHPGPAREWLEDCADALVGPLLSIGCVLDVQAVVIDGDLPDGLTGELVGRLRELLAAAAAEAREPPALRIGTVGRSAAATGAAILPLHLNYSPSQQMLFGP
jgi:predicted NBD/HSP70 family sugar kinase